MSKFKESVSRSFNNINFELRAVRRSLVHYRGLESQITSLKKQLKETNHQLRLRIRKNEEDIQTLVTAIEKVGKGVDILTNATGHMFDLEPATEDKMVIKKIKKGKK